ncbi:ATP-binding protein [Clostridium weizhouense]|uniref:GHKL domain-containing protein n=1 Tax=Clostridium weizhouense TaxID=2859781 RepID=A0ABS7AUY4_9CLOT|nr:ATP-binding protein [Clostridium weizhouense]MBW6411751.1 GHKL domain-containing protein [Clostridium weizhouense]
MKINKNKKNTFEKQLILIALLITSLPLILSYTNLIFSKLEDIEYKNKIALKEMGNYISESQLVKNKLELRENDYTIEQYTKDLIRNFNNVDIIVIADMTGKKYSHIDESQIGQTFIGSDKEDVLNSGKMYYSLMQGSMGKTLRWFQPIYSNDKQVGFVMTGKYYNDIVVMNSKIKSTYLIQLIFILGIAIISSKMLALKVKRAMHNMEPYEISKLYSEKKIIINTVNEGIIALNKNNEITEINKKCYELVEEFDAEKMISKLKKYINSHEEFEMKEFIIQGKKLFISIKSIEINNQYLGSVIRLIDKNNISKIAKEITGVDQVVKNLRANVHEFKNNLYVILGLLQLKKYNDAEEYILKIRQIQNSNSHKFSSIDDYYVRALLLSRELVSKERKIEFILTEESFLFENHKIIDSLDLITIIGNLIENAFEACSQIHKNDMFVKISLYEDEEVIEIQVEDNGIEINEKIKENIFEEGISSKGDQRGTGLYLVKNRVELYNGRIEIDEFRNSKVFVITISKGENE